MSAIQGRRFCFTLNNYDEAELVSLRESLSQEQVRYAVFGKEISETGTPHLQGYIAFTSTKRFKAAKKMVCDRAHVEVAKGNEASNFDYCSKDGCFEEFGKRASPGKRMDLEAFKDIVKRGVTDKKQLIEDCTEVYAKYPRFVNDYLFFQVPEPDIPMHPLKPWQQELYQRLIHEPEDRKVIFAVDYKGNTGKSWFAKYYCKLHENGFYMRSGKHADMAYAMPPTFRVLFIDCTRKKAEFLSYSFIEEVKDGYVSSFKYESFIKRYPNVHVVVLMNENPAMDALSSDRYDMMNLDQWSD